MSESNTLLPGQHWQCVILLSNSPFRQDWFSVLRLESLPHWLILQCPDCVQTERMYASRSGDNLIQLQFQWHYCDIVSSTSPRKKKNTETAQTHGFLWKSGTPKSCDPQWIIIGCLRAIFWPADPKALWGSQWAPKRHHRLRKWVGYPWRPGKMCGTFDGET